jgi:hypothetical protein
LGVAATAKTDEPPPPEAKRLFLLLLQLVLLAAPPEPNGDVITEPTQACGAETVPLMLVKLIAVVEPLEKYID